MMTVEVSDDDDELKSLCYQSKDSHFDYGDIGNALLENTEWNKNNSASQASEVYFRDPNLA